jgi:hypothetical protein
MERTCEWSDDPGNPDHPLCGKPATSVIRTYTKQHVEFGEPLSLCAEHFAKLAAEAIETREA